MSAPGLPHIDAVARAIYDGAGVVCNMIAEQEATRVLTSPDPAVHAAMLDALVRHGVLTEHVTGPFFDGHSQRILSTEPERIGSDEALAMLRERLTGESS